MAFARNNVRLAATRAVPKAVGNQISCFISALRGREILALRHHDELPFKELAANSGAMENTVTVQARRCLDELIIKYRCYLRTDAKRTVRESV
jgi:hypothetical protein